MRRAVLPAPILPAPILPSAILPAAVSGVLALSASGVSVRARLRGVAASCGVRS